MATFGVLGSFRRFENFKSGIFYIHLSKKILQNGENFLPKKSLIELCLYARPTYSPGSEHYMLKLAWTL
jgi:hypothetical protein